MKLSTENSPWKLINTESGEVFDIALKPSRSIKSEWVKLFLMCAEWLSKNPLKGESIRILLFLIGRTGYGNRIRVSPTDVATELGLRLPNVSRAYKELRERDVLHKEGDGYILNPLLVWRGSDKKRQAMLDSGRKVELPGSLPVQPSLSLK